MLTDEQYGRQLGVRLRHETADLRAAPDLVGTLRRRRARRTWAIRTAIATPVAAAAAAAILATTAGQGAPGGERQTDNAVQSTDNSPVRLENVAHVQAQTVNALSQASQYVIYAKSTHSGGYYETWIDKATQRYRNDVYDSSNTADGVPMQPDGTIRAPGAPTEQTQGPIHLTQSHSVRGPSGDQSVLTVDYDLRTWFRSHITDKLSSAGPDITDADSVRKAITKGTVELLGREKVDGIDTLHLRLYGPKRSYRIDMWVDSKTYRPVQDIAGKRAGDAGGQKFPASAAVTTRYSWLPRTQENLKFLVLTPPPGFKRVR